jgi:UDP-N-acetylmuramate dehydrogenase
MANVQRRTVDEPTPQELRQAIIDIRREKLPDPAEEGNAGSFFMNPVVERQVFKRLMASYPQMPHYVVDESHVKIPAGWLIEQCGWKGHTLGRAGVHDRQALVLVNRGGATGADIVALSDAIRASVYEKFGITIVPEANIV